MSHDDWIEYDLVIIERSADALLVLDSHGSDGYKQCWTESSGCLAEIARAEELDIPVFYSVVALENWREDKSETVS